MYAESLTGAVDIRDEDDNQPGSVGDYMFTPMYTYVYDYRYRCPPAYSEVCCVYLLIVVLPYSLVSCTTAPCGSDVKNSSHLRDKQRSFHTGCDYTL